MSSTSDIPEEIKRLRLCSALRDCGKLGVEQGFKQSVKKELFVYDDQSKNIRIGVRPPQKRNRSVL